MHLFFTRKRINWPAGGASGCWRRPRQKVEQVIHLQKLICINGACSMLLLSGPEYMSKKLIKTQKLLLRLICANCIVSVKVCPKHDCNTFKTIKTLISHYSVGLIYFMYFIIKVLCFLSNMHAITLITECSVILF